jgi:lysophospholipase L1-like esterase
MSFVTEFIQFMKARKKTLIYALYLFFILVVTVELITQTLVPRSDRFYIFPPNSSFKYKTNQEFTPGIFSDSDFRANSLGIRSEEFIEGAKNKILILGGSTGLDQLLDQNKAWTSLLQQKLVSSVGPTWVGNLSRSSRTSRHNIDYFEHIIPYMPKAELILVLVGANDFQFFLKSSFGKYTEEQEIDFNFSVRPDNNFASNFGIYRFYRKMIDWYSRRKYSFISDTSGIKAWRDCRQSVAEKDMINKLPDLNYGLDEFRRNLNELADRASSYGATIVFITQPTLWKENVGTVERNMLLAGGVGSNNEWCKQKQYYTLAALAKGIGFFNEITREVCHKRNLTCIDLDRQLSPEYKYFYDDMHFSEAGADKVAEILEGRLSKMLTKKK